MKHSRFVPPLVFLIFTLIIMGSGCIGQTNTIEKTGASWNLSPDGTISFMLQPVPVQKQTADEIQNYTVTNLTFSGFAGDVHAILIAPHNPLAFLVWAPGANNPAAGYLEYMKYYPDHQIGVLILDVRGNGGLTPGYPMNIEQDVDLFMQGKWPQFYLIASDMITARRFLDDEYPGTPVYALGDSNGGRYASLAAGSDPEFDGYIGISTSGFSRVGDQYRSPIKDFLLSIDPDIQIGRIPPRPVILFHAPDDPVIPFTDGKALAESAGKTVTFIPFNGTHGVNREVDDTIITLLTTHNGGGMG